MNESTVNFGYNELLGTGKKCTLYPMFVISVFFHIEQRRIGDLKSVRYIRVHAITGFLINEVYCILVIINDLT